MYLDESIIQSLILVLIVVSAVLISSYIFLDNVAKLKVDRLIKTKILNK